MEEELPAAAGGDEDNNDHCAFLFPLLHPTRTVGLLLGGPAALPCTGKADPHTPSPPSFPGSALGELLLTLPHKPICLWL